MPIEELVDRLFNADHNLKDSTYRQLFTLEDMVNLYERNEIA